ncbi:MAG TPA: fructose-bisphosphatase class III [Thermoanaerobaculia bacterium]|nr:fructose-bisphosphatase class III [Thermoanaerobaculia bacterium]
MITAEQLVLARALSDRFPTIDAAAAEMAALRASLTLPKGTVHVVSDVHGEYKKLRHIINNASGHIRPLVRSLFDGKISDREQQQLLALLYYPMEAMEEAQLHSKDVAERVAWVETALDRQFAVIRALSRRYRRAYVTQLIPADKRELFDELMSAPSANGHTEYLKTMLTNLVPTDGDVAAVRAASRLIRNLSVSEIIVAGDLGDRGPRLDRVIDYLMQQPHVTVAWGNHDVSWMGACLGQEALIATVLRISLRYRRISQLEEGYGVIIAPLEKLARDIYGDDPAEHFKTKGSGLRDDLLMARMQKAIAIIQFKLEGQVMARHPEWKMDDRRLLHRINYTDGTVTIGDKVYPLIDRHLPTINPEDPYRLSAEEQLCVTRLRESFVGSQRLWQHMSYIVRQGAVWLRRDEALIFHGCVPVDDAGEPQGLVVDGAERRGRELFDALDGVVRRAFRKGTRRDDNDADWLWYLWTGPTSPLFGKDRMASFESYFVADKEAKKENKNAYFKLIHDAEFCRRIARGFGLGDDALIVNGHVPVKVEKGETPVKKGGNAVTIDGAFSEAYGDRGYTLILEPERIALAEHHHFDSIREAITSGADIIPTVTPVKLHARPRTVADTEAGTALREEISAIEILIGAYRDGVMREREH